MSRILSPSLPSIPGTYTASATAPSLSRSTYTLSNQYPNTEIYYKVTDCHIWSQAITPR